MTVGSIPLVSFEDYTEQKKVVAKLKTMKKFSNKDYYRCEVRTEIVKKLKLKNEFWKNFVQQVFLNLKNHGFVVIKGLPFDNNDRLLIGISSILGMPIEPYRKLETHMVRKQSPGENLYDQDTYPHTDSPHWPIQNDLTAIQCLRKDQYGQGFSRVVLVDKIINDLKKNGLNEINKKLSKKRVPFLLHSHFGTKGFQNKMILTKTTSVVEDKPHVRFGARYIENCIKRFNLKVDSELLNNVLIFEKTVSKLGQKMQFLMEEDDFLVIDNKRVIHSRSSVSSKSKRLIKKVKINLNRKRIFPI